MVAEEKHTTLDYYLPISAQASIMGLAEYSGQSPEIQQYQEELTKEHAEGALVDVTMSCRVGRLPEK